jgi:UTP-glucose-1-phosphate uridylyltransferase
MTKIRWGILGAANIARTRVLPAMALAPSVELTAVASRTLSTATEWCAEFGIERLFLVSHGRRVAIAGFLGPQEKESFALALSAAIGEAKRGPTRTVLD